MIYTAAHHKGVIEEIHTISILNDDDRMVIYGGLLLSIHCVAEKILHCTFQHVNFIVSWNL